MFTKYLKSLIFAALVSVIFAGTAFAGSFPYEIEFDLEKCDRICYAGHPGATVVYKDGIAVTPDTTFHVVPGVVNGNNETTVGDLSVTVSLIYENDDCTGSYKETVKQYNSGDLNTSGEYRVMSDNSIENLKEREKLYSGTLSGLEVTLVAKQKDIKKKSLYLYVCSEDDYYDYLSNASYEDEMTEEDYEE